ncbi:MAG: DMT family transporter [Gammaproteobacteria bacterium]|nr:DMT family transporter [Gammaproteobacteria bacterium]
MKIAEQNLAKLAAVYSGLVFGVYWIPLRALAEHGISGIWPVVVINVIPLTVLSPLVVIRPGAFFPGRLRFHVAGFLAGITFALYAAAFLYTEVVRVVLLFYLTPVWGFLLARAVIGDAITPLRWMSICLGLGGMLVILGVEVGLPAPHNAGDWMALAAGITWAFASLMLLTDSKANTLDYCCIFYFWSAAGAAILAGIATVHGISTVPDLSELPATLPWLIPVAVLVILPAGFAAIYGPTILNPGVVGLLFMTEISVATITAAWLAGEPFGTRELLGVVLITLAGALEPVIQTYRSRTARAVPQSE